MLPDVCMSHVLLSLVSYTLVYHAKEASACSCWYGSWAEWGDCSSMCFGTRQRSREVFYLPGRCFPSSCTARSESSACNKYCENGGVLIPGYGCRCALGFSGQCCTIRVTTESPARPEQAKSSGDGKAGIYVGAVFAAIALLIAISVGVYVIYKKDWANPNMRIRPYSRSRGRNHNTISMIEYNGSDDASNYTSHGYRNGYRKY